MLRLIKCLFCGEETKIRKMNTKRSINGKSITITNAPVYHCEKCNEIFLSKEVQDAFGVIKDKKLDTKSMMFNYDDLVNRKL